MPYAHINQLYGMGMKITLKVHKVWDAIEGDLTEGDKNDMAIALMFQSIPEILILQVGELDTTKKVWETIKSSHVGAERVKEARLQTLMNDFDQLKMKVMKQSMILEENCRRFHQRL